MRLLETHEKDLSLHHFIRFNILDEYIETDSEVTLQYMENLSSVGSYVYEAVSDRLPSPVSLGRGWVYLDTYGDTTEQESSITVYSGTGAVISGSNYMIDYVDGRIITGSTNIVPAAVTYKYFYVSLVNEWEDVEAADVPVVVVNIESFNKVGFQLGGGRKVPRRGHLHIFATNRAERDDLLELLYDGINQKCCPNQNWTYGTMLDWDGTFNYDYAYETIEACSKKDYQDCCKQKVYHQNGNGY